MTALRNPDGALVERWEIEASFDDLLDDDGPVSIGSLEYEPSEVLKAVDPTAYRCGLADYVSALIDNGWAEL